MVVAEQNNWAGVSDVVFVVEGTANLSPYVESMKANYIQPTLEYFNGGPPDDRDCGCDYNSTMYALVVFMTADCAPEPAALCYAPTTSTHKLLSWLERISFIGGSGEACSHIAEGLSTALQVFDDFIAHRDPGIVSQKHCILICNSPPYPLPTLESPAYSGIMAEQIAALMAERKINFSILSPRKIPALYKLYEKAGGDLQLALTKNYAKDRRHLVLLSGYQLHERPMTPPALEGKGTVAPTSTPLPSARSPTSGSQKRPSSGSPPNTRENTGFKQPATTQASPQQSTPQASSTTTGVTYGSSVPSRGGVPTPPSSHLSAMNQPNPPNVTITTKTTQSQQLTTQHVDNINRPTRGQSPVPLGSRIWNQATNPSSPVSTPPTTSVLANQLSVAPGIANVGHPSQQNVQLSTLVSQSQSGFVTSQPGNDINYFKK
ncbi:mediator of RNA polymerase II transcription subunit 25-like [Centruroides sculpturatus]|uniref:mediator of RNA polymerase II transcription subunit 25-like n=1 Tax=Centruroides sculpturatus TaxID=218467 RepID=UPI000C6E8A84|nr:mediator of RNA polymerase II transcription subunit 25-like [Centruroides sculpturatus]